MAKTERHGVSPETNQARATEPAMAMDLATEVGGSAAAAAPPSRQGDGSRPYCDTHNCLMTAASTQGGVTHYKCQVPGCEARVKRARPMAVVPTKPLACAFATCREPTQYLAVDRAASLGGQLKLTCPNCGRFVYVPRPSFLPDQARRPSEPPADFSDR